MPLIACPECGKSVSSAAPQCVNCGHPIALAVQTTTAPAGNQYQPPQSSGLPRCTNCGADSLKRLALIHAGGVSLTEGSTKGLGVSLGGSVGFGVGKTTAATQTALSAIAQPPSKRKVSVWAYVGAFVGLSMAIGGFSDPSAQEAAGFGVILLVGCAIYIYNAAKFNRNRFPGLYAQWERSYMCERCGTIAVV